MVLKHFITFITNGTDLFGWPSWNQGFVIHTPLHKTRLTARVKGTTRFLLCTATSHSFFFFFFEFSKCDFASQIILKYWSWSLNFCRFSVLRWNWEKFYAVWGSGWARIQISQLVLHPVFFQYNLPSRGNETA